MAGLDVLSARPAGAQLDVQVELRDQYFSHKLPRCTDRTAGRRGRSHLRTQPRRSPPACLLACAARPRLVPVRGAPISRLLPAFVRRRRPRHVDVPSRTGGFVPGCLRSAPRPDPFRRGGAAAVGACQQVLAQQVLAMSSTPRDVSGLLDVLLVLNDVLAHPAALHLFAFVSKRCGTVLHARSVVSVNGGAA